jgi:hypothetical protein
MRNKRPQTSPHLAYILVFLLVTAAALNVVAVGLAR